MKIKLFFSVLVFLVSCPLFAGIVVLNGLSHTYKVEGGNVYKGYISVHNTSNKTQNVKFYQQDYRYDSDGTSYYEEPGSNQRSNALWTQLSTNLIRLEANGKMDVYYEITIPENIEPGSYWNVVMVEPVDDIKPDESKGVKVNTVVRYAVLLVTTTMDAVAEAKIIFKSVNLTKQDQKNQLDIVLENQGQLYHRVIVTAELFDNQKGDEAGFFQSNSLGLLPNTSKRFTIDLSSVSPGKYSAVVLASGDEDHIFGINVELNISDD